MTVFPADKFADGIKATFKSVKRVSAKYGKLFLGDAKSCWDDLLNWSKQHQLSPASLGDAEFSSFLEHRHLQNSPAKTNNRFFSHDDKNITGGGKNGVDDGNGKIKKETEPFGDTKHPELTNEEIKALIPKIPKHIYNVQGGANCEMLVRQIAAGKDRLTATSREEAEKALRQLHIGAGADPMNNAADFNSTSAKDYFKTIKKGQEGYYHWDEEMVFNENLAKAQKLYPNAFPPTNGYCLKNHDPFTDVDAFVRHLQIHPKNVKVIKIYFP